MENGINKKGFFDLKVEPHLKPISDLGIGFYNLDENTATLRFQLSNSTGLLLISDNNLSVYGYFESSNGSVSDVIELEITDELNGIAEITLDQDFLHASTSTKVTGQLYIGVKNVDGRPDYNEVAVLGEFTFEVADALINKVSSFTKIEYIRMFSQLKAQIQKDVVDIQEAIKNGADYVAEMQTVKEQGIAQINQTVTEGKGYIDSVITQAQTNINNTATSAIGDVKTAKDNAVSDMNAKVFESVGEVQNTSSKAITHIDGKVDEFNGMLETEGFVTSEELGNQLDELEWQKHKFTEDDGQPIFYTSVDPLTLPPGQYQISYMKNNPFKNNGSALYNVNVLKGIDNTKQVIAVLSYTGEVYIKNVHKDVDLGWKQISNTQKDTGWISFSLINGAESNTAYKGEGDSGFDCAYRTITNGSEVTKKLRINGTNLTPNQVIAQLPKNFAKETQAFPVRVPNSSAGGYVVIRPSGTVNFYVSGDRSNWDETGYAYGECTWHD